MINWNGNHKRETRTCAFAVGKDGGHSRDTGLGNGKIVEGLIKFGDKINSGTRRRRRRQRRNRRNTIHEEEKAKKWCLKEHENENLAN